MVFNKTMAKQEKPSVRFFFWNSFNVKIPSGSDETLAKSMESIGYTSNWKHFRLDVGKNGWNEISDLKSERTNGHARLLVINNPQGPQAMGFDDTRMRIIILTHHVLKWYHSQTVLEISCKHAAIKSDLYGIYKNQAIILYCFDVKRVMHRQLSKALQKLYLNCFWHIKYCKAGCGVMETTRQKHQCQVINCTHSTTLKGKWKWWEH